MYVFNSEVGLVVISGADGRPEQQFLRQWTFVPKNLVDRMIGPHSQPLGVVPNHVVEVVDGEAGKLYSND